MVDLAPWHRGTASGRADVASQFDRAASSVGFVQIVGHGIADTTIDDMVSATDRFFGLPLDRKLAARAADLAANRGYTAAGTEALSYSIGEASPPDLFEAFNMGDDDVDDADPFYASERHRLFAPNVWPEGLPELRTALRAYFAAARDVALTLTDVFAEALELSTGWFRPFVDRSTTTLRTINYEQRVGDAAPLPDQQGMGAHTDYGIVTVLWADGSPGLEVYLDGDWHAVATHADALLVNLGDLTAEWTNDRWRSTLHRVVPPAEVRRRRSTAFFFDGNWDARIECVPTCTDSEHPPKYPPVVAGAHLMSKLMGPRTLTASDAVDTSADRR